MGPMCRAGKDGGKGELDEKIAGYFVHWIDDVESFSVTSIFLLTHQENIGPNIVFRRPFPVAEQYAVDE